MNGFINLLKPSGMSSSSAVAAVRAITGQKKSGHSGTLDPLAAGVLPLCLGRATKLFDYIMEKDKEYLAELTLGAETDTQDADGEVILAAILPASARRNLRPRCKSSAAGYRSSRRCTRRLCSKGKSSTRSRAAAGQWNAIPENSTSAPLQSLSGRARPAGCFKINCSKGTYIRTLCADIGRALGCYGYMSYLLRTASGRVCAGQYDHH